jgi:uncharacterized protein (DUF58 family)
MDREAQPRDVYASTFAMPLVLGLIAVLLSIALVTAQTALTLLCMLVLFTAFAAKLWSLFSLARVSCRLSVDKSRLFAGELLELRAHVDNDKLLPIWLQVRVQIQDVAREHADTRTLEGSTGLLSYQRTRLRWQVTRLTRGVHKLDPVELVTTDPLGFFSQKKATQGIELVVYPRLVPLLPNALPRRDLLGQPGPDSQIEDPTFVHGVREYQAGRAARYIHWKASARVHRLLEKLFERSAHERVLFVLRAEQFAGDLPAFERALETLASWAVTLDREGITVGLATDCALHRSEIALARPGRSAGQLAQLLEILARAQPRVGFDLAQLVQRVPSSALTTLVFFSYELDAEHALWLQRSRGRQKTISVVCGPGTQLTAAELPARALVTHLQAIRVEAAAESASCS